ncbi:bifunctional 2-polyprenyl-6-hydroxyphenol methylase/3-demethylubiquinol 3-O-methyltransferase UbiG [Streptomyces sp. TRM68367]|uniref:class I SAM-dependent methyltransferase n=1 Tax=Streptomyces sp. TRM68367 TaxID=2758415 RepID=UPI00165C09DA|nr:class I SAM-dependent methyltransferase [Streptomyces sp. TRM68367]MBC9728378.1 class I SAM-dependent methyltransferase [Streptomyces sp. TRM68367]
MGLNYNDHYHTLLLKQIPPGARTALDVGCGTGGFARLLAARGLEVEGVDADADMVKAAQAAGGGPSYRWADVRGSQLPEERYDFISCIASLHHMPFDMVLTLRKSLAPGGVLAVLGLYSVRSLTDFVCAFPARTLLKADRLLSRRRPAPPVQIPTVWPPPMSYAETRTEAARLLPGATVRRLLFYRYLLVYRA